MRKLCAVLMMLALAAPAFAQTQIANGQRIVQRQVGVAKILVNQQNGNGGDSVLVNVYAAGNPTSTIVGGVYYVDSTGRAISVDGSGNAGVSEASKDRDFTQILNLYNNQLGATATTLMDSSAAVPTYNLRWMALMLQGTQDSLSTDVRIAVEVRAHESSNADSSGAYPWIRWTPRNTTVALDADSLGQFAQGPSQAAETAAGADSIWSGEFIVKFAQSRLIYDGSGNTKFGAYPRGMCIPLVDQNGAPFRALYTSVRFRVINGVKSRFKLRADLVGGS